LDHHFFEAHQQLARLLAMRTGADAKVVVGLGNPEFLQEHSGHQIVVMLASVYEYLLMLAAKRL